jgi:hypothetical protein
MKIFQVFFLCHFRYSEIYLSQYISFSRIHRSISVASEQILFTLQAPHLSFSLIHRSFSGPQTKTMNWDSTVFAFIFHKIYSALLNSFFAVWEPREDWITNDVESRNGVVFKTPNLKIKFLLRPTKDSTSLATVKVPLVSAQRNVFYKYQNIYAYMHMYVG